MKKLVWQVRRIANKKKMGVIRALPDDDEVCESAARMFGHGIYLVLQDGRIQTQTFRHDDELQNETYVSQHHDDRKPTSVPNIVRPWPEEEFGNITYNF